MTNDFHSSLSELVLRLAAGGLFTSEQPITSTHAGATFVGSPSRRPAVNTGIIDKLKVPVSIDVLTG